MNIFGLNLFGPKLPIEEQHLNYVAGCGKTSPFDSALKQKIDAGNLSFSANWSSSAASATKSVARYFFYGLIASPVLSFKSGASILSEAYEVCTPLADNRMTIVNYQNQIIPYIYSGVKTISDFLDLVGIPHLTGFQRQGKQMGSIVLPAATKATEWLNWMAGKMDFLTYYECMGDAEMGSSLYPQRIQNYLANLIRNSKSFWNHELTPLIFTSLFLLLAIRNFKFNAKSAEQSTQEAREEIELRFSQMALAFEHMAFKSHKSAEEREKVLKIAQCIVLNAPKIQKELGQLELPNLSFTAKRALVDPLLETAHEVIQLEKAKQLTTRGSIEN